MERTFWLRLDVSRTPKESAWKRGGFKLFGVGTIGGIGLLETTAPNVWAVGECAGSPYFTHVSENDFHIIHANLNGGNRSTRDRLVPYCLFIDPPLGRVGIHESQARVNNTSYRAASLPMAAVFRPQTLSETRGFMKVLIDAHSDRILGFAALGPEAGGLIGNVQGAMLAGPPDTLFRERRF